MNLSRPRHSNGREPEVPVDLPHVIVAVAADGTLTATVDGTAHPRPAGGVWTQATFGSLMDAITKDRTVAVRVEIRESDGVVFTDIIRTRKPALPVSIVEESPALEVRRVRGAFTPGTPRLVEIKGEGFVPGEDVAVAVIVNRTGAAHSGIARAGVDLDDLPPGLTGEVLLFGRVSGTMIVRRLQ